MVEQLEIAGRRRQVRHRVADENPRPAHHGLDRGFQPKLATEEPGFLDRAANCDPARVLVDRHLDLVGGKVGDLPMQAVTKSAVGMEFRGTVALQAAADQQLVKAVEPAQPVRLAQADVRGMDRPANGRFPAEARLAQACPPYTHPAGRQHGEVEIAVADLDDVNPPGKPAAKGSLLDATALGSAAQVLGAQGHMIDINVTFVVNKCPISAGHGEISVNLEEKYR